MIYVARKGQFSSGVAIGILLLDAHLPLPPGDVANATTYSFPVRYKVVKAASIERLIYRRDRSLLKPFIEAGLELVREGVKAITSDCGFMILFQEELANEFPIPVFVSSLLQIPFIHRTLRRGEKIGIITADSRNLTEEHLKRAGADESMRIKVIGMEDKPNFYNAILEEGGILDFQKVEHEVVDKAKELVKDDEEVRSILLECSNLPPYAAAVQEATNLPVYDFNTMINYVFSSLNRHRYHGFV
jgi:Asp/Glu/hydantoin racemase